MFTHLLFEKRNPRNILSPRVSVNQRGTKIVMTQIFHLPNDIRQEFSIDENGLAYASQSAIARLCGITRQSINELFEKIVSGKNLSESLKPFAGKNYTVSGKISDVVVAAIINHYAMYAKNTTEEAKRVSLCFQAIGIRTWIQNELGWQKPNPDSRFAEDLMLADYAARAAQNAGVDKDISEQIKLDSLMKTYPDRQLILKPQKDAIASSNPLPNAPMTSTEVGKKLAIKLGLSKVSARKVNTRLSELGYQQSITRTNSKQKEVHDYYKSTEKGKQHSKLLLNPYVADTGGHGTKAQLRWFDSIVDVLANNWEEK